MVDYLFLAGKFNKYSGPNNHILDLCNHLYNESKKSLVLVTHPGDIEDEFLKQIRFPTARSLHKARHLFSNLKAIRNTIKTSSPRRIFVNCDITLAFQTYFAANKRLLLGYNVFLGGGEFYSRLLNEMGSRLLVSKIVAHTNFHRKNYIRIGIEPSKITVIPHCVDIQRIHRALEPDSKTEKNEVPVIMFVGGLKKSKGIIELLRTYEKISVNTDVHLLLVGSGQLETEVLEMKKQIERKNPKASIMHIKRVPLSRLMSLMNNADVIAIPSHIEYFGLVALEAMALKKAVLATCFGGISEVITNEVDGILVNPFDSQQLQSRLEELISDPIKRDKLGRSAYQTVKNKYEVSVVAPRFIDFLEGVDTN